MFRQEAVSDFIKIIMIHKSNLIEQPVKTVRVQVKKNPSVILIFSQESTIRCNYRNSRSTEEMSCTASSYKCVIAALSSPGAKRANSQASNVRAKF